MQFFTTLSSLLTNMSVRDVIDILVVAVVFYLVFELLRRSRSFLALRSLVLLLTVTMTFYFVAEALDLLGVSLLFSRFWTVIVIIYLIVYQSSFRRAFQELGQIRLVRALIRTGGTHIDTLASAVIKLSEKQIGALFVLSRRNDILPIVVTPGVEIDAVISEELIITIFFSYNPLHDGAVLIENDRIVRANMTLPISRSSNVPRGLGTRHRAALEITELTDAVAIVVSEETGTVSLVQNGIIERGLNEETLLEALEKAMNIKVEHTEKRAGETTEQRAA